MEKDLPPIPAKRYFTIGEVGDLCGVKPHVLRYWEQEFTQLRPMKRRGNRRYYQHHEVLMIRRIRELLYDQGFTISGARNKLQEIVQAEREMRSGGGESAVEVTGAALAAGDGGPSAIPLTKQGPISVNAVDASSWRVVRQELLEIRSLLGEHL
ncbi:MerR family transcriptional regulator [Hydrogenophaga crassostreae]|uniref:MerR family transcriptional regulator n=1 Tax=Hydrogenophaga crassostreae TaxID=1763535 RepID=A0A167I0D4_9BURK|nr:MerR family transcriptional regulator [Hydrogenophaga crassostreae]AOW13669.1 MerR family transcriptional regulator [Hydrogenophaga crassostreae]OAD41965.1 MerR family transcriptional regulator [Hydrogenophaga crassostreae]